MAEATKRSATSTQDVRSAILQLSKDTRQMNVGDGGPALPLQMTAMEVVAWFMTCDRQIVALAGRSHISEREAVRWDLPSHPDRRRVSLLWLNLCVQRERADKAVCLLVEAARAGCLKATAWHVADGKRTPLDADWWQDRRLVESDCGLVPCPERRGALPPNPVWENFLFDADDVLALRPAPSAAPVILLPAPGVVEVVSAPETAEPPTSLESAAAQISAIGTKRRKPSGRNYQATDAQLVEEMREGIDHGDFKNATDAARALAKSADGGGAEESRMKRLLLRYKEFRTEQFSFSSECN